MQQGEGVLERHELVFCPFNYGTRRPGSKIHDCSIVGEEEEHTTRTTRGHEAPDPSWLELLRSPSSRCTAVVAELLRFLLASAPSSVVQGGIGSGAMQRDGLGNDPA